MEPLRGGLLANLPEKAAALLGGMPPVEWAYRFLQSVPGVTVVLSGASSMEQMKRTSGYSPRTGRWPTTSRRGSCARRTRL